MNGIVSDIFLIVASQEKPSLLIKAVAELMNMKLHVGLLLGCSGAHRTGLRLIHLSHTPSLGLHSFYLSSSNTSCRMAPRSKR